MKITKIIVEFHGKIILIIILKKSLNKFNKINSEIINFINKKFEVYNNLINREIESIFTDEYNEKIKIN